MSKSETNAADQTDTGPPGAIERTVTRVSAVVTARPLAVVLAFLVLTAFFGAGLSTITVGEDLDRYTEGTPEQDALDTVESEFEAHDPDATTMLVYEDENVLDRSVLLQMISIEAELTTSEEYHVDSTTSPATFVAQELDPAATTVFEQQAAIDDATDEEVSDAVRAASTTPEFERLVSTDFEAEPASATVAYGTMVHDFDGQTIDDAAVAQTQQEIGTVADERAVSTTAWGDELFYEEVDWAIEDSLGIVVPVVLALLSGFLIIAYRDPIDVGLALASLGMVLVWTFGVAGFVGIPFDQLLLATAILLLALGIDFGIHLINRYREERVADEPPTAAMAISMRQIGIAFGIVTVTASIGFGANGASSLGPIRDYGFISSVGILATFAIFGVFLPAAKVLIDTARERYPLPTFGTTPIGLEGSRLGWLLPLGYRITAKAPVVTIVAVLVLGGIAGVAATDMDREYNVQDFLPPEEQPAYVEPMPDEMEPDDYASPHVIALFSDQFVADPLEQIVIYLERDMTADGTLTELEEAEDDPPQSIVATNGTADGEGITDVIRAYSATSPEFAALVDANDETGNGLPDRNLEAVYEQLFDSPYGDETSAFLSEDMDTARIEYAVESDVTREEAAADATEFAAEFNESATATGDTIIFNTVDERMVDSALVSLVIAVTATALFLIAVYRLLEGEALLGLVNLFPILLTVALLGGTMVALDVPLNSLTATVFAVTIGIGVDYSVHITHRFVDEVGDGLDVHTALVTTLQGTGGALTGSMLTTVMAMLALLLALSPILSQFGLLMAIGIAYAYVTSMVVLPAAIVCWDRWTGFSAARAESVLPESSTTDS